MMEDTIAGYINTQGHVVLHRNDESQEIIGRYYPKDGAWFAETYPEGEWSWAPMVTEHRFDIDCIRTIASRHMTVIRFKGMRFDEGCMP
jgi:hypothetical protein